MKTPPAMSTQRKITWVLFTFICFCAAMEAMRMWCSFSLSYIFLLWNLMLAWVPYALSLEFIKLNLPKQRLLSGSILLLWVLFLPNGPYIITDLVHLRQRAFVPVWYDVLLVSSCAWTGLLLALLSVRSMHRKLQNHFSPVILCPALFILFLSSGYGIYLGRFMRWNSWDVFVRPVFLLHQSLLQITHPFHHPKPMLVTLILCMLLSFTYMIFYLVEYKPRMSNEII